MQCGIQEEPRLNLKGFINVLKREIQEEIKLFTSILIEKAYYMVIEIENHLRFLHSAAQPTKLETNSPRHIHSVN